MFVAAKWRDPVIGVDIHLTMAAIPPSPTPVPTPLPHVFVGVVFDPLGAAISAALSAASGGGLTLINGMPAANTGTDVIGFGHSPTPPATSFAPNDIPSNDGTIITGSKTVSMGGSSAGRLTSVVMSCNFPVNMPTSVCMAVPAGAPVLIGGPESMDIMAAVGKGIRTKWFSKKLHQVFKIKPGTRLSKAICFLTGHPVDVMTGEVSTDALDFELPGPIPLRFERNYSRRDISDGPLGPGWQHPLNMWVNVTPRRVRVRLPDGREREHRLLETGESLWDDLDRYELKRTAGGYRLTFWDGRFYDFEPVAKATVAFSLVRIGDRCGNEIVCRYRDGRLDEVTDSAGRELRFVNEGGRLAAVQVRRTEAWGGEDERMELVRYTYQDGRLASAIDPLGNALLYEYLGGVLAKETNRNGLSFYFEYDWEDPEGYCVRTWGDGGIYERRLTYDKFRHMTVVEDSRGGKTHYWGNAVGLVEREIDPTGCERRYEWDEACRKVAEIDGLGNRTEWAYDARGNRVLERDALGNEARAQFNKMNLPIEVVDAAGGTWKRVYDRRGLLKAEIDPLGNKTRFSHDPRGNLTVLEDALGSCATFRYSERGELVSAVDFEGNETRYEVDDLGRIKAEINALGGATRFGRDLCGRVVRVEQPDGSVIRLARDAEGNVVERADELGNKTRSRYAGMNRLVEQTDPLGGVMRYSYDTEEDLVGVTNEIGEEYRFELDMAGRVVKEIGFDGRKLEVWYDRAGRSRETVNAAGKRTKIERDALGRVVKLRMPGPVPAGKVLAGVEEIEYGYDERGGLVRAKNSTAEVLFERDALGRVARERVGEHWIESRYDAAGRRVGRTTSCEHETSYELDGNGALRVLAFEYSTGREQNTPRVLSGGAAVRASWRATLGRDALGNESERALSGDVVSQWTRDRAGRPSVHRVRRGEAQLSGVGYQWRSATQIAAMIDTREGPTHFTHDARSYLVAATSPDGSVQHRAADAAGNVYRTAEQGDRRYGPGGRLLDDSGVQYRHDADGQIIEKTLPNGERWAYRWDALGQLARVVRPDGRKVSFAYDALGRRVRKEFEGKATAYVWDGNDLVHELAEGAALVIWESDPGTFGLIAKVEGEERFGTVVDHLGTPTALVDDAGEVAWKAQLDLFGVLRTDVAKTGCPWRWPGQYEDKETGLYYNRFRYYDPGSGTYIGQDPIRLAGGMRLYAYPRDPFVGADPFGLMDPWDILYSQDSISSVFQHGKWADRTLEEAIRTARRLGRLPEGLELKAMLLNRYDWVTLTNRTLYVAQEAGLANVHPVDLSRSGLNQLRKLCDGNPLLPRAEQPRIRQCK